jgi:hypothetical protein
VLRSAALKLTERLGWTLAQVALAAVPVAEMGWPVEVVPVVAAVLALLKGAVAKKLGDTRTAATLPASATA